MSPFPSIRNLSLLIVVDDVQLIVARSIHYIFVGYPPASRHSTRDTPTHSLPYAKLPHSTAL